MNSTQNQPSQFDVKIIGAGIAGLAAGLALSRKGHHVTIFEASSDLSELGAGIQLQPNATRILYQWALQDEFLKVANEPRVLQMRRYANDAVIGEIAHNPQQSLEYGYPHWQVYRPDLQRLLADAAVKSGVNIEFGRKVVDVDVENGELMFEGDTTETADLVVAADGISSRCRELLPSNKGVKAVPSGDFCFRAVLPRAKMNSDAETAELMKGKDSMVWVGPGVTVLGYTVSGGDKYNTLVSTPKPSEIPVGRWGEPGDVEEARALVSRFCPAVKKVWSFVEDTVKWTLGEVPPIDSYVSKSGRFVLIGDAAHAILPHLGQGGGLALEDCAALAECVSCARNVNDLAKTMKAYQDLRQPRIENVRQMAYGNQEFMSLEDGPGQEERDKLWGMMTSKWKDELKRLGEEGIKNRPRPKAIPGKDMRSPESRQYLCGYDVFAETEAFFQADA